MGVSSVLRTAVIWLSSAAIFCAPCVVGHDHLLLHADGYFLDVGEESREAVEVVRQEGIELVIVALAAAHRGAEPGTRGVADAIGGVLGEIFLGLAPPSRVVISRWL